MTYIPFVSSFAVVCTMKIKIPEKLENIGSTKFSKPVKKSEHLTLLLDNLNFNFEIDQTSHTLCWQCLTKKKEGTVESTGIQQA